MKALIQNGKVIEVSETAFAVAEGLTFVDTGAQGDVAAGWTYDGTAFTPPDPFAGLGLQDAKSLLKRRTTDAFRRARDGGVSLDLSAMGGAGTIVIATMHDARQELHALKERLTASGGTQKAVTRSGVPMQIDAAMASALLDAIDGHHATCNAVEHDHIVAIDALTDIQAAETYDPQAGFPAMPEVA